MGFFDEIGKIAGEIIVAPISIVNGVVEGMSNAIDRITDD